VATTTCIDAKTGEVIGHRLSPAAGDGRLRITFGDIVEPVGGTDRCISVLVDIEKLAWRNRQISDMLRRHEGG
jgi:hypothetical protein